MKIEVWVPFYLASESTNAPKARLFNCVSPENRSYRKSFSLARALQSNQERAAVNSLPGKKPDPLFDLQIGAYEH